MLVRPKYRLRTERMEVILNILIPMTYILNIIKVFHKMINRFLNNIYIRKVEG